MYEKTGTYSFKYNGKDYKSIADFCRKHEINESTFRGRLALKWTFDQALNDAVTKKGVTFEGRKYSSIESLAEEKGIVYSSLRKRLNKGMTLEEALSKPFKKRHNARQVEIAGKVYDSISSLAREKGIDKDKLIAMVNTRENIETAVHDAETLTREVELWGTSYKSLSDLATKYSVDPSTLAFHFRKEDTSLEDALMECLNKGITYKGVKYESFTSLCADYGHMSGNVYARLVEGWALDESLTREILNNHKNKFMYKGNAFPSRWSLLRYYGISRSIVDHISKSDNIPWDVAFDLVVTFLDECKGERPIIVTKLPLVIYNGIWFKSISDFLKHIGLTASVFTHESIRLGTSDIFDVVDSLKSKTINKYNYKGEILTYTELKKILGSSITNYVRRGQVELISTAKHVKCSYNPTGYCLDCRSAYTKYKNNYIESYKNGGNISHFVSL
ncbi:hypothetical protein ABGV42_02060 [Paenibacillus pabuli]|uniref:hypothetical protein n=1 Tax=Paenibacillus pabuli TaxID=1472 RepID=UPI003241F8A9